MSRAHWARTTTAGCTALSHPRRPARARCHSAATRSTSSFRCRTGRPSSPGRSSAPRASTRQLPARHYRKAWMRPGPDRSARGPPKASGRVAKRVSGGAPAPSITTGGSPLLSERREAQAGVGSPTGTGAPKKDVWAASGSILPRIFCMARTWAHVFQVSK